MGRIQTFDSTAVVRSARDLFWDRGFEATSIAELEHATGLGRSSLYHAFGSKRGLFDAAVGDYLDTVIRPRLRRLHSDPPDPGALLDYFESLALTIAGLRADSARRGCLLVNCAAGLAAHDDPAREIVDGYRAELTSALRNGLGARMGGVDPITLDERARLLASLSMSAMLLARINRGEAVALLSLAGAQIQAWSAVQWRHGDVAGR